MPEVLYMKVADKLQARRRGLDEPLRLPVEQNLASEHRVGRDTMRRALKVLEERRAVTRRPGRGTYLQPVVNTQESLDGQNVGFVPPWWADSTSAWFTSTVLEGVSRWSNAHACHLSVLHAEREPHDKDQWVAHLRDRRLAGLVWLHPRPEQMPLIEHTARFMPCVVVGRQYDNPDLHYVVPDYAQIVNLLDTHLVERGHTQYAVLGTSIMDAYCQTWLRHLGSAYQQRGETFHPHQQFVDIKPFDRDKLCQLLLDLYLPVHPGVSAFVLTSSSYLRPLIADDRFRQMLESRLSVVTWDFGLQPMDTYWPGRDITHVACDWPRIGHRALDTLSMIAAGRDVPRLVTEPVSLQAGQTVLPASASQ